ncbi:hypothetical protein JCGZ_13550 [Jatropha curcas]|uniref:Uncharacterized protein n=1 Tax=Jatropha curcas TaxID=180498 RepID=A0A067KA41_JATCU|nr:hypothetical protein JCGZ_13550 [Jatropha curcas]
MLRRVLALEGVRLHSSNCIKNQGGSLFRSLISSKTCHRVHGIYFHRVPRQFGIRAKD